MSSVSVEYCGQKGHETDCIAGTGLTWVGVGSTHDVPLAAWEKMAKHPDVWKLAEVQTPLLGLGDVAPAKSNETSDQFDGMDDDALKAFAEQNFIKIHHKQLGENLRAVIRKAIAEKD